MSLTATSRKYQSSVSNPLLWAVFIVYLIITGYTMMHHEMWVDEIHSWNIAKGSAGYFDLISNTRYEGHPPVWYTILWSISKFTHKLVYVQFVHWMIAAFVSFLVIFASPFSVSTRLLIPFGYYFIFEYSVLSRNYAVGVLLALCICYIMLKDFRGRLILYYALLFLLTNTHLLGILLAASLHLYFLLLNVERKKGVLSIFIHIVLGILISLPALYFIFPPSDSQLSTHFWVDKWDKHQLVTFGQAPLRAFVPIPAWWKYNFWNSEFLLEAKTTFNLLKVLNFLIFLMVLIIPMLVFRKEKKSLVLFVSNLVLSFVVAVLVFPLTSARYAGFLYICFITAYWLYSYKNTVQKKYVWMVNTLLIIQVIAGIFTVVKDIQLPFSNANKVTELMKEIPSDGKAVTDYWALNTISAFADTSFYCVDMQKEVSFLLWDSDLGKTLKKTDRYTDGVNYLFHHGDVNKIYMISLASPQSLSQAAPLLAKSYKVTLIDKRVGAIERGGDLYLYEITANN